MECELVFRGQLQLYFLTGGWIIEKKEAAGKKCSKSFICLFLLNSFGRELSIGEDGQGNSDRVICTVMELFLGRGQSPGKYYYIGEEEGTDFKQVGGRATESLLCGSPIVCPWLYLVLTVSQRNPLQPSQVRFWLP